MAYAHHPNHRRIVVPARQSLIEPGTLTLPAPPPPPPPPPPLPLPPIVYVQVPFSALGNPSNRYHAPFPANPTVAVPGPVLLRYDPAFLIQMDDERTRSLLRFMANEGLEPSPEEEMKRKEVINQLKKIVLHWIKKVAWQHGLPKELIRSTSATILAYGSYGLGVHGPESDIDALCIGPHFASLEEDFFVVLREMFERMPEVTDIHCVKNAKVPLMRFKFNGISVDFPYAQLQVVSVSENINIFDPLLPTKVDEPSWRSLSGVRANTRILQLVPHLKNFQALLCCIKLWAKRRGVYCHLFGFFGGIHWAILAAYICEKHPNASVNTLLTVFFETFSQWQWPKPVILQDRSIPYRDPDGRSLMPIMMPCSPFEFCNSNVTRSTFNKIRTELLHGYVLTRNPGRVDFEWNCLFEVYPYATHYAYFLRIFLAAPTVDELSDWVGWVKSRIRSLLLKLESMQIHCDPNPTEYVDHNIAEPNTVFYWGLSIKRGTFININSVKEDFMRSLNNEHYSEERVSRYKLKLSLVDSFRLPKSMRSVSGGCKACQRIFDPIQWRKPMYSQCWPHYLVGYAATDREYQDAVG
ncbi:nuclear poly(A) polymerase 3 isoform X1 [Ananas comosus]|uniref:polynucleotide adenylyltransferase n=1 Tax=Ananas comosus TaxID=4615 RepID=A0A6P5GS53_ANACO|nr:nuclear poly(A) polymerase 3 isoform X1 [Ananas comosus]